MPFKVEYALTGQTCCWGCSKTIKKYELRFVESSTNMYHFSCFFRSSKPRSVDEIAQVDWLHTIDQDKIRSQFDTVHKMVTRSQRKNEQQDKSGRTFLFDFKVERTKLSLSFCESCKKKIPRDEIRISKKVIMKCLDDDEDDPNNHYHLECFAKCKEDLNFYENAENLPGFKDMNDGDQKKILKMMTLTLSDSEDDDPSLMSNKADLLKMQDKSILKYRDFLKGLRTSVLDYLLMFNGQETISGKERKLDLLSDIMNFGALELCKACGGQLVYKDGIGYRCTGNVSSWSKCNIVMHKPPRKPFYVPIDLAKEHLFLAEYKERVDDRLYVVVPPPKPVVVNSKGNKTKNMVKKAQKRKNVSKNSLSAKKKLIFDSSRSLTIYEDEDGIYSSMLSLTDVQTGRNSFYKIQLLFDYDGYFVKRSWGKIGTDCSKGLTERMRDIESAKKKFFEMFLKKTGNHWHNRADFVKKPDLMFPMDIDESQEEILKEPYMLSKRLKELISMIFNVDVMLNAMKTNELDLMKMPLGKLSRVQIYKAFAVLAELKQDKKFLIDRFAIDASNRFYTLIPHSFRRGPPPILNTEKNIDLKFNILEELLEIETAYAMLKETRSNKAITSDIHYNIRDCDIKVLDKNSKEYEMVENYAYNNNSALHGYSRLKIIDVFKIERKGEDEKYKKKSKDMPNKMLLWHGSRLTNFAGILSQGLRIAPPEAPKTGYMFGKGIYFADMISKSANYCDSQNEGLILLCEVALGDMYMKTYPEFIKKLPKGKNSTKGLGRITPDASGSKIFNDVTIPCGKIITTDIHTCLHHNEYVVYDVDQVKIQYLLRIKLN